MSRPARSAFERAYTVVVLAKGLDGSVELLLGLLLVAAPGVLTAAVLSLAAELGEGPSPFMQGLSGTAVRAAGSIGPASTGFAVFLLVHGVVKIATVVFLLQRLVRAYPWAIAALAVLTVVQGADLATRPSAGGALLAAFDLVVVALVAVEYRRLRRERREREQTIGTAERSR